MINLPATIFLDIDGTLIFQGEEESEKYVKYHALPGAVDKIKQWRNEGHRVVLTTARAKDSEEITVRQLKELGIEYDILVMGLTTGQRFLINDLKPYAPSTPMAVAVNLKRNEGIEGVSIE